MSSLIVMSASVLFGEANRVYAGNQNDKSRYGEDRYQGPSCDRLSQRNPKPAVPLGFIVSRHDVLCCALLVHLISVCFLSDNQANLKRLPKPLSQ